MIVEHNISPRQIPQSLLDRYATHGPRYTSYPTAPQFQTSFDVQDIEAQWRGTNGTERGLSLYIHIPFCKSRCLYCGCFTETGHSTETTDAYVQRVLREAEQISQLLDPHRPLEQLALGGGTPCFLAPHTMALLLKQLQAKFNFASSGERSLEIDPRYIDHDYLDLLISLGFNRFSFGVQDLHLHVQKLIGRTSSETQIRAYVDYLRQRGIYAINLDLIYGLPGQTEQTFAETIQKIADIRPSRIALFGYAHVPWLSHHQKTLEQYDLPDANLRTAIFGLAYEELLAAGYLPVGMDHFALPDDELITALQQRTLTRNFMGYTTRRGIDLVGLGASSISSVGGSYTQNTKDIQQYIREHHTLLWHKALILSPEDVLRREIIIELFCNFFLNIEDIESRFALDFQSHFATELHLLESMQRDQLLDLNQKHIAVSSLGRFFIRNICMVFDQYLNHSKQIRYSQTL
jgi:oxygen-independent coproporphyrinogen-3 oxidase